MVIFGLSDAFPLQLSAWSEDQYAAVLAARERLGRILVDEDLAEILGLPQGAVAGDDGDPDPGSGLPAMLCADETQQEAA